MEDTSILQLIPLLWKHKIKILGGSLLTGIVVSAILLIMPNYYQSSTTFYPINNSILEPRGSDDRVSYYGDDHDIDRLLSMSESNDIIENIIQAYKLDEYYNIDATKEKGKVKLFKRFKKNYNIKKTEFDAIEISIEDQQPAMAQKLTQAMRNLIDEKGQEVIKASQKNILSNFKKSYEQKQAQLEIITDSLNYLRSEYGIYNTSTQAEAFTTLEVKNPSSIALKNKIKKYSEGIATVSNLLALQDEISEGVAQDQLEIQNMESILNNKQSILHIIQEATLPIEKSRPKRSLYVLGFMVLAAGLIALLIIARDSLQKMQ